MVYLLTVNTVSANMSLIGHKIKYFRRYRNTTQKELGVAADFNEKSADVRIAQYESGKRTPKGDIIPAIAHALNINILALATPATSSYYGLMHTFFELEDKYGLRISKVDGRIYLKFAETSKSGQGVSKDLEAWYGEYMKFKEDDISTEDYNEWRYTYPEIPAERTKKALNEIRENEKR